MLTRYLEDETRVHATIGGEVTVAFTGTNTRTLFGSIVALGLRYAVVVEADPAESAYATTSTPVVSSSGVIVVRNTLQAVPAGPLRSTAQRLRPTSQRHTRGG